MSKWREVRLGEVAPFKYGKSKVAKDRTIGEFEVYSSSGICGYSDDILASEGIIVGRKGSIGTVYYSERSFFCIDTAFYIDEIDKNSSLKFMYYYLKILRLEEYNNDAAVPGLNRNLAHNLRIQIPDLETQEKIADVLSTYDELIENNNRRIEILEKTAEEIYKEWFVRMRFPGHENAKFEKGIPEGWEVKKVGSIISFDIGGGWGKDIIENDFTEKAYVIRGTDIPDMKYGNFNYETLRFHKKSNLKSRKLSNGDIVFEASGGSADQRLGRTIYITDEILSMYDEDVICASFCKLIRIENKYLSWFFNHYLNYSYKTEILSTFEVQSTGISNFGFTNFKKHHNILVPEENLLKEFYHLTYDIYININKLWSINQNLTKQRDLLLPRLMNGTIEVK